ncbi:tetratricopeptide repeat-containing sensor histidine kinase [Pedobacter duraquae]|uniref:histidine kinase n=1 Tax=Pedobacter duraquae TaxID=425511 RepID=A0A4R6ICK2_9SPHI|nr:ATP-binding protein [Pedobacter duraquae]TDO19307.1 tetratricopeptide repeat protein [Pedobacter duraquae]
MKKLLSFFCFSSIAVSGFAQVKNIDSLKNLLNRAQNDAVRISLIDQIMRQYASSNWDSIVPYAKKKIAIAEQQKDEALVAVSKSDLAKAYYTKGNYSKALELSFQALTAIESLKDKKLLPDLLNLIGNIYKGQQNYTKAKQYFKQAEGLAISLKDKVIIEASYGNLAYVYEKSNKLDSAIYYANKFLALPRASTYGVPNVYTVLGEAHLKMNDEKAAAMYFRKAFALAKEGSILRDLSTVGISIAGYFQKTAQSDSAIYYANNALMNARKAAYNKGIYESTALLYALYDSLKKPDSAFKYLKLTSSAKDSIYNVSRFQEIENLNADEHLRQTEIAAAKKSFRNKLAFIFLCSGFTLICIATLLQFRNNNNRKKAYAILESQKKETENQKDLAEHALKQLQVTQAQLIQAEKMASLGELTAGIAHEIQNPLNFINNFSEVNIELLEEMDLQLTQGDMDEIKAIMADLKQNEERIGHHGKRADSIVKGMLQHSRTSTGEKRFSDVNELVDEAMKLAYHGLRAKDHSFNAELLTDFDSALPQLNLMPQDIVRVLVNLFNNAFYAVQERGKTETSDFRPSVSAITTTDAAGVKIIVRDNGTGVPPAIKEKIMQPFFTTKPTGEGTGLGLSMSYDIVKAHGGELKVTDVAGGGSEFEIVLPL